MSKFKRLSFTENQKRFPLMNEEAQKAIKGGCSDCNTWLDQNSGGVVYTQDEYYNCDGTWEGGFVCGLGYTTADATVYGDAYGDETYCSTHNLPETYGPGLDQCSSCINGTEEEADDNSELYGNGNGSGNGGSGSSGNPDWWNPDWGSGGGGGGGSSGPTVEYPDVILNDGVDVSDSEHFTFNTSDNQVFNDQLTGILESNSVVGNLLGYFDKGVVHMTFNVGDIVGGIAETNPRNDESFHINFGEKYINENGWNKTVEGKDNMNYNWEKAGVKSGGESLLVTLVHEAMHANHYARFQEADRASTNIYGDYEDSVKHMKDSGYSQEFIDLYYYKDEIKGWTHTDVNTRDKKMHDYMCKHNGGVIDAALEEYRKENGN